MASSGQSDIQSITYMALTARACDHAVETSQAPGPVVADRVSRRRFLRVSTNLDGCPETTAAGAFGRADERAPEAFPGVGRLKAVGVSLDTTGAVAGGVSAHQSTGTSKGLTCYYPDEWQVARCRPVSPAPMGYSLAGADHFIENGFNDSADSTRAADRGTQHNDSPGRR